MLVTLACWAFDPISGSIMSVPGGGGGKPDPAGGTVLAVFAVLVFAGGMWGAWQLGKVREKTPSPAALRGRRPTPRSRIGRDHGQAGSESRVAVGLAEDRLEAPLRSTVEGMRRLALSRGGLITVEVVSSTEAVVHGVLGSQRLTLTQDGRVKAERL